MSVASSKTQQVRARAEAGFKTPEQRAADTTTVMAEIGRNKAAEADKTLRLRGLRLARDEAERAEAALSPKPVRRRKPSVKRAK
jgi:hypothetical protein